MRPPASHRPARRAGTWALPTTWAWVLRRRARRGGTRLFYRHPAVHRAGGQPKELHFFDAAWEEPFGAWDDGALLALLSEAAGWVTGEWTPGYLIDFWTPELVARAAPDTRVRTLLRDPMGRFRSGLTHQLATSNAALTHRDIQGAFGRGLYAPQLRRVFDAFPLDRVFVGQYEARRAEPAGELRRTYEFLGLAPFEPDADAFRAEVNPTTREKFEPPADLRAALLEGYAHDLVQLPLAPCTRPGPVPLAERLRSRSRVGPARRSRAEGPY